MPPQGLQAPWRPARRPPGLPDPAREGGRGARALQVPEQQPGRPRRRTAARRRCHPARLWCSDEAGARCRAPQRSWADVRGSTATHASLWRAVAAGSTAQAGRCLLDARSMQRCSRALKCGRRPQWSQVLHHRRRSWSAHAQPWTRLMARRLICTTIGSEAMIRAWQSAPGRGQQGGLPAPPAASLTQGLPLMQRAGLAAVPRGSLTVPPETGTAKLVAQALVTGLRLPAREQCGAVVGGWTRSWLLA